MERMARKERMERENGERERRQENEKGERKKSKKIRRVDGGKVLHGVHFNLPVPPNAKALVFPPLLNFF
jgi:hypothetical protein